MTGMYAMQFVYTMERLLVDSTYIYSWYPTNSRILDQMENKNHRLNSNKI
jgi:hypothetical protein